MMISALLMMATLASAEPVFMSDLDAALAKAAAEKKHVFLDYYTAWCPPCQALDKDVLRAGELARWEKEFVFVHLDGDELPESKTYKKYPLTGYPTVWILSPDGKPLGRHVGFDEKKEFLEFMSETLAGKEWKTALDEKLKKEPDSADALAEAFTGALITGDTTQAAALKKRIQDKREEWDGTYERALLDEASTAMYGAAPDYAKVFLLADAYLSEFPKGYFGPGLVHMKAKALRASGKAAEADALAASLPSSYPESISSYWRLMEYARVNGVLEAEATAALETGLKKFPKEERFLVQAVLFLRAKDPARAGEVAKTLKGLKPGNGYYDDLIRSLHQEKKRDG